jgi:CRP-like cAMP-binding protein
MSDGTKVSSQDNEQPVAHALIAKLGRFVPLTEEEREALRHVSRTARRLRRGADLISEGDKPDSVFLLLEGWAYRYKSLVNGGRQIMAYLLPGDLCDVQIFLFEEMDHSIGLLSDALVAKIPAAEVLDLMDRFPRIERALLWATLVDEATLREWLLNVGQRDALQRLAHLFCELCVRLGVVSLVDESETFSLPLTQAELADTTGMTTVHVNRSLQRLRKEGLIVTKSGKLTIVDFDRLAQIAGFNRKYLHIDGPPTEQKLRSRLNSPM